MSSTFFTPLTPFCCYRQPVSPYLGFLVLFSILSFLYYIPYKLLFGPCSKKVPSYFLYSLASCQRLVVLYNPRRKRNSESLPLLQVVHICTPHTQTNIQLQSLRGCFVVYLSLFSLFICWTFNRQIRIYFPWLYNTCAYRSSFFYSIFLSFLFLLYW